METERALALLDAMRSVPRSGGLSSLFRARLGGASHAVQMQSVVDWLIAHDGDAAQECASADAASLVALGGLSPARRGSHSPESEESQKNTETGTYRHYAFDATPKKGLNVFLANCHDTERGLQSVLMDVCDDFAAICEDVLTRDGHEVLYKNVRTHPAWPRYLLHVSQLASARPSAEMSDDVRKACFLNLYNALIIHAKLVYGHPTTIAKRGTFFNNAAYYVCGTRLTSVDLEHQVLRGKAKPESPLHQFKLSRIDPRMHFVLNCGARSCPPIRPISTTDAESNIRDAASCFIGKNVIFDGSAHEIRLSRLWKWFRNDFTPGTARDQALLAWISSHAPDHIQAKLTALISRKNTDDFVDANTTKVKFARYDWADNGDWNAPPDDGLMFLYDASFAKQK